MKGIGLLLLLSLVWAACSDDGPGGGDAGEDAFDACDAGGDDAGGDDGSDEKAGDGDGDGNGDGDGGGDEGGDEDPCATYPYSAQALYNERAGFGRNTIGGDPQNVYHVTTLANDGSGSLRAALESVEDYWIVFDVEGRIVLESGGVAERVQVQSNKTIDGRGRDITIEGNLVLDDVVNVIISDVRLTNELEGHCTQDGDVLTIRGTGGGDPDSYSSKNIWVHHVELFLGGDGLLDIRGGSQITISWCHLHDHKKAMLAWLTRDDQEAPGMRVTYHHNYLERITLRGPQFVFGWAHFFNNYQFEWYEYGAGSLGGAQFYSENNIYQARPGWFCVIPCPDPNPCGDNDTAVSKDALVTDWAENGAGYAISVGDLALENANIAQNQPQDVFIPSVYYSYTAEVATEELAARIAAESGPRVNYCQ